VSRVRQFYDEGVTIIKNAGDLNEIGQLWNKQYL
jgi:hypothetical protein